MSRPATSSCDDSTRYEHCFGSPERQGWLRVRTAAGTVYQRGDLQVRALLTRADRQGGRQLTVSVSHRWRVPTPDEVRQVALGFLGEGPAPVVAPALMLRNTVHLYRALPAAEPALLLAVGQK